MMAKELGCRVDEPSVYYGGDLAIRTTMMISRNYLIMRTPGILFAMSVSFTHRMDHILQFRRRPGRPPHRFLDTCRG